MLRGILLSCVLLVAPLASGAAQTAAQGTRFRLAGGLSSQQLTGPELGLPGISGAIGVELAGAGQFAGRLEYQGFLFAGAGGDLTIGGTPEPTQVNHAHALVLAGVWRPTGTSRLEVAFGPGAYRAESDAPAGTVSAVGIMAGAGFRLSPRVTVDAQYHHAELGDARALLPVRLSVLF